MFYHYTRLGHREVVQNMSIMVPIPEFDFYTKIFFGSVFPELCFSTKPESSISVKGILITQLDNKRYFNTVYFDELALVLFAPFSTS